MSIPTSRAMRRQLERDNAKLPATLQMVPRSEWPDFPWPGLIEVWRSRDFLVQVFDDRVATVRARLSINRTQINAASERWVDGISWDDLQRLKNECGFGDYDGVEVFPRDGDVVCVANIRHIFIMEQPLAFAWRKT